MPHIGPVETVLPRLVNAVESLAIFLVVSLAIYLPGRYLVVPATRRVLDAIGIDETFELPFIKVLHAGFGVLALFAAGTLSDLTTLLTATAAITAAATIALGFAAQDVLGNFVSGAFIVFDPQFNIGDWIQWKDKEGIVEDISFRVTRVHTFDNELITVPNAELTRNAVTNPVSKDRLRITYTFGIGYEDDIDRARKLLLQEAHGHEEILNRPGPRVNLVELADSYIALRAQFWISNPARTDFLRIRSEYVQAVKERFDQEGIEMPYPYRQLTGSIETRNQPERRG